MAGNLQKSYFVWKFLLLPYRD